MNIMIAAVGIEPGFAARGGSVGGAAFIVAFVAVGFIFLVAAGRLSRRRPELHAVRYTARRF